jgi:cellulose 1,4-beta-cellobiosidase
MGQLVGTMIEMPPPVDVAYCTKVRGCHLQSTNATLDANWRWIHGVQCSGEGEYRQCYSAGNCYTGGTWDKTQCPDPKTCAENCALEAVTAQQYSDTYGVSTVKGGVELKFVSGQNVGSRLYLTEAGGERYKLFKLKNREFSFDVDVSTLSCGLNGAVYFSEMEASGGMGGRNKAGAKFGTGYCDAQCPHDVKFMDGAANILEWNSTTTFGKYGACCHEMDIWEANKEATAFTTHPCSIKGTKTCSGLECGGLPDQMEYRYKGVCDKDGCDFNSFRNGEPDFYGEAAKHEVDSSKPFTVVTQWITDDGTDDGDLVEIRRLHVQDGTVIQNSRTSILPGKDKKDDSITDGYCDAQKAAFGDPNEHKKKGGLKAMGDALDRGVVLVLSLWDDGLTHMKWLDSYSGNKSQPGKLRGPCKRSAGAPSEVRAMHGDASVKYTNFMYGELDSTYTAGHKAKPESAKQRQWPPKPAAVAVTANVQQTVQAPSVSGQSGNGGGGNGGAFSQCGGKTWTGRTQCPGHCKCVSQGPYYSQCTPPSGAWSCEMNSVVSMAEVEPMSLGHRSVWFRTSRVSMLGVMALIASATALVGPLAAALVQRRLSPGRRADPSEGASLLEVADGDDV